MTLKKVNKYFLNILFNIADDTVKPVDFQNYFTIADKEPTEEEAELFSEYFKNLYHRLMDFTNIFDFYDYYKDRDDYQKDTKEAFSSLIKSYLFLYDFAHKKDIAFIGYKIGAKGKQELFSDETVPLSCTKIFDSNYHYGVSAGEGIVYCIMKVIEELKIELTDTFKVILTEAIDSTKVDNTDVSYFKRSCRENGLI